MRSINIIVSQEYDGNLPFYKVVGLLGDNINNCCFKVDSKKKPFSGHFEKSLITAIESVVSSLMRDEYPEIYRKIKP